jgi:hypothetical protein
MILKIPKFCKVEDKFKRNNFLVGKKFKVPIEVALKIQEAKQS